MTNPVDFAQVDWNAQLEDDCRQLIRLAVREDLDRGCDLTTVALVPSKARGSARIVARQDGVVAGLPVAKLVLDEMDIQADWQAQGSDGDLVTKGSVLARIECSARDLLTAERTLLNFLGRMCGIATQTHRYVQAVAGTRARIYDTRKTTPGWRRLEKYAVRRGGGTNHRTGLFDAVLIKDNHLAMAAQLGDNDWSAADAVRRAHEFLGEWLAQERCVLAPLVEVEVDTLEQLEQVLVAKPDIVLLDNMTIDELSAAVAMRNTTNSTAQLEASGGITLESIRRVAETGVERISVGALTHSAVNMDVALDWE